jgi:hypothetical protein
MFRERILFFNNTRFCLTGNRIAEFLKLFLCSLLSWKPHENIKNTTENDSNNSIIEIIFPYKASVRKPEAKRPRCMWKDSIKVDVK